MHSNQPVVLVTGGAQGIGMGITEAYARTGYAVVVADVDVEATNEHVRSLTREGHNAFGVTLDVAREDSIRAAYDLIGGRFGRLDVLVNNAGAFSNASLEEISSDEWDHVINVNLRGPFLMSKYGTRLLCKAQPGNIINIASTRALMSEPNTFPYSASKGGIVALTHSLAVSLGPDIRVNAISPGWIEVGEWKKESKRTTPYHRPQDLSQHPVGRVGKPQDIASACLFLTSKDASFVTGANFVIDGGMTIKMIYEH